MRKSKAALAVEKHQKEIIDQFGKHKIDKLQKDLCGNCQHDFMKKSGLGPCRNLLPITTSGENCPYYIDLSAQS